jgi:hypothetical protein
MRTQYLAKIVILSLILFSHLPSNILSRLFPSYFPTYFFYKFFIFPKDATRRTQIIQLNSSSYEYFVENEDC